MQLARSLCIELLSRGVSAPHGEIACVCESNRVTIARSAKNDRVECMLIASRRETAARVARGFLKENRLWRTPKILLKGALRAAATRRCYAPCHDLPPTPAVWESDSDIPIQLTGDHGGGLGGRLPPECPDGRRTAPTESPARERG